jgi:rubrerythrin
MAETLRGKVTAKAGNGKGFKLEGFEGWLTAQKEAIEELKVINKGDEVEITYTKNKVFFNVSKITKIVMPSLPPETTATTGFVCEVCGKALKDNKFKKCYTCNKDKKESPKAEEKKTQVYDKPQETKSSYICKVCGASLKDNKYDTCFACNQKANNSPEKTAQIQRGNALNAASTVMSNPNLNMQDTSPEALAEATKVMAQDFLDWLRCE